MVRPSGRRGDADLGPVTNRTSRVEGRPVTASCLEPPVRILLAAHTDRVPEGDRVYGEEQERVRTLHIQGKSDERGDDDGVDGGDGEGGDGDGDGGDDDHDDGDDDGDEEQPIYVAPVAPASGSDRRPRHGEGKGLTGSLMSIDVVRDVPAPTQKRKKVKPSDWEQTEAAEGGPIDPELIPSYGGHVAGRIWRGHVFIFISWFIAVSISLYGAHWLGADRFVGWASGVWVRSDAPTIMHVSARQCCVVVGIC
ncbi:hypothetical protein M9H77_08783 [Catharanthus roseus]|uniref:Uncharacterized protein n=1 Tax=Catharanthus roseus TaxID=4058 RepID=A0ACC0BZ71_CATRO|nr:hypothetical protein M9H77_08783 [Catharanthus roseus]